MPPEYTTLFNAITDASLTLRELQVRQAHLFIAMADVMRGLNDAQIKAEELFIEQGED